jgi:YesN/AraC family two-component response regulator
LYWKKENYKVIEASDGEEGLELYFSHEIDLVITDISMPKKNGIDAIIEITTAKADARIIAITGMPPYQRNNFLSTAEIMGASKVLLKPFTREQLLSAVEELLGN